VAVLRVHEIFEVATKSTIDFDLQLASGASPVGRHPFFLILAPYLSIIVTGPCIAAFISYLYRSEALVPLSSTRAQEPKKAAQKKPLFTSFLLDPKPFNMSYRPANIGIKAIEIYFPSQVW